MTKSDNILFRDKLTETVRAAFNSYGCIFGDNLLGDENTSEQELVNNANAFINICNMGEAFKTNPNIFLFNEIVNLINTHKLWELIPMMFGTFNIDDVNWSLKAYKQCKDNIPIDRIWGVLMNIYLLRGYDFPKELIFEALPNRPKNYMDNFPEIYKERNTITVYRACQKIPLKNIINYRADNSDIMANNPQYDLSWTFNPYIAKCFFEMYESNGKRCYYCKAEIAKKDIINYFPFQCEIIQHNSVFNLVELPQSSSILSYCNEYDNEYKKYYGYAPKLINIGGIK